MKTKRAYYPPTTIQQRKLLFEIWEQDKHVTRACQRAHVGRATFYYWKARYDQEGYAGLERYEKQGAPKGTGRIAEEIEAKVVALHKAHTEWGKERINQEMTKANNWVALVSRNTVRRILEDAGMWNSGKRLIKKRAGWNQWLEQQTLRVRHLM